MDQTNLLKSIVEINNNSRPRMKKDTVMKVQSFR